MKSVSVHSNGRKVVVTGLECGTTFIFCADRFTKDEQIVGTNSNHLS